MYGTRKTHRRGLVLLVVLGVLALFSILAVTYLTFASNSRQAAFNTAQKEFHDPNPKLLMDEAIGQVLRGTTNIESALFRHDLLGDYYGYNSVRMGVPTIQSETIVVQALTPNSLALYEGVASGLGRARGVTLVSDGVIKVPLMIPGASTGTPENIPNNATSKSPLNLDDAISGRTITFLAGPLKNTTHRVLRWAGYRSNANVLERSYKYSAFIELNLSTLPPSVSLPDGTVVKLSELLTLDNAVKKHLPACLFYSPGPDQVYGNGNIDTAGLPGSDDTPYALVLNPIPLNTDGIVSYSVPTDTGFDIAIQPNYSQSIGNTASTGTFSGNADETYDGPDHLNFFLSYKDQGSPLRVIPSFHRPFIISRVQAAAGGNAQDLLDGIRGASLRPLPLANFSKAFTGGSSNLYLRIPHSNNNFARTEMLAQALQDGPWDVDNDGDGTSDSIWIDAKLPVISAQDGTRIRPLIAVQIEDLSARFNLNAHGNLAHTVTAYNDPTKTVRPVAGNSSLLPIPLPIGRGLGPSEILPILSNNDTTNRNVLQNLLSVRYSDKRRSEVGFPSPGITGDEFVDQFLTPNHPRIHLRTPPAQVQRFGLPVDRFGRGALAIDSFGNLYNDFAGTQIIPGVDEAWNDPYEFSAGMDTSSDSPFTLEDFESIIDRNRWSQSLQSSRLLSTLAPVFNSDSSLTELVTPISKSSITPPQLLPPELANDANSRLEGNTLRPSTLVEGLLARVVRDSKLGKSNFAQSPPGQPAIDENDIAFVNLLLAPELRTGRALDLNRAFGNGIDDNMNLVIDEPLEPEGTYGGITGLPQYNLSSVPPALRPASAPIESPREALARHIYCLAMLLVNDNPQQKERWRSDTTNIPTGPQLDRYIARRIAQWAVNVVDYRDSDAIMTRFIFDYNPLNGWNTNLANNDPTNPPEYAEVWGCEFPELVFMESLAFHDVRVRDTELEQDGKLKGDEDPNTDQIRKPEGSLFLELYNPRSPSLISDHNSEGLPSELYRNAATGLPALNLSAMAPIDTFTNTAAPVWRIAITEPHQENAPEQHKKSPEIARTASPQAGGYPDTYSFDPHVLDELAIDQTDVNGESIKLERFIVFINGSNPTNPTVPSDLVNKIATAYNLESKATYNVGAENIFCNINPNLNTPTLLPPATYLTISPRTTTHLGSLTWPGIPDSPSPQRFESGFNSHLIHFDVNDNRTTPAALSPGNNNPNIDTQSSVGFIAQSTPPPQWSLAPPEVPEFFGVGNYGVGLNISEPLANGTYYRKPTDFLKGRTGSPYLLRDAYWDFSTNTSSDASKPSTDPYDTEPSRPLAALQPQADPEPKLGTEINYRTAYLQRLANPLLPFQPDALKDNYNPYRTIDCIPLDLSVFSGEESTNKVNIGQSIAYYASRQRNGNNQNSLFSYETDSRTPLSPGIFGATIPYIVHDLGIRAQSMGYLNESFGPRLSVGDSNNLLLSRVGQPTNAFAMHPWLNRPFTSPLELMMVPATSQGRLFEEFSTDEVGAVFNYQPSNNQEFRQPFNHLINFLDSDTDAGSVKGAGSSHLYRIFEYVTARASFKGETDVYHPLWSTTDRGLAGDALAARNFWGSSYRFPFNIAVKDTAIGRLNLNTINDARVLAGLNWNYLTNSEKSAIGPGDPSWLAFNTKIRGNWKQLPEETRPFSSSLASKRTGTPDAPLIDAGILREFTPGTRTPGMKIGDAFRQSNEQYNDPNRNTLMRYQSLMRLSNLTTGNSQTYLVRITMGFFEYDDATGLGKEHLVDYGRNKRYRATYVIDRSVPVSYETGQDRDTRNCILLERFYRD